MLPGLLAGQEKMSKSDPNSAIFMEDDEVRSSFGVLAILLEYLGFVDRCLMRWCFEQAEVKKKIKQAFCPPQEVAGNPCIEYVQYIVLPWFGEFEIQRDEKNGGNK